jgi:hypothetical protein
MHEHMKSGDLFQLLQQNQNDINNDSTFVKIYKRLVNLLRTVSENASSSQESRAHEKAIHTPLIMRVFHLSCYLEVVAH